MNTTNNNQIRASMIDQIAAKFPGFAVIRMITSSAKFSLAYLDFPDHVQDYIRHSIARLVAEFGENKVDELIHRVAIIWTFLKMGEQTTIAFVRGTFTVAMSRVGLDPARMPLEPVWTAPVCEPVEERPAFVMPGRTIESHTAKLVRKFHRKRKGAIRRQQRLLDERRRNAVASARRLHRVRLQSGKVAKEPRLSRLERDRLRAEQAKHDAEVRRKSAPKAKREAEVKAERDKRNPAFQSGLVSDLASLASSGAVIAATGAVCSLATQFFMSATNAARRVGTATDMVSIFVAQLSEYASALKARVGDVLWKVPLVMIAFYAAYLFRDAPLASVLLLVTSLSSLLGREMWAVVAKFFPDGNVRLQSGLTESMLSQAPKVLAAAMTFSVFARPHKDVVGELAKRIAMFDRVSSGWEVFLDWFMQGFETAFNYLRGLFNLERLALVRTQHLPMREWCQKADTLLQSEVLQTEDLSSKVVDDLVRMIARGGEFKTIYMGTPMGRMVESRHQALCTALLPYQGSLTARNNFRVEPVMMMVYGAPGIGKTLMATQLAAAIMLESELVPPGSSPSDIKKEIWQKGTSEFWNGYVGQAVLVMDDAFQMKSDPTDKENEMMSIIRMVSSWSFPLNFADLASKGKIYFGSKFIYGTTNLASIDSEARTVIHEPEAVFRRMHTQIRLRVAQPFALQDGKLDYHKFMEEKQKCKTSSDPLHRFPWHVWEACQHNFLTGSTSGDWKSFSHVVREVSETLKGRLRSHANAEHDLDDFIGGYAQHTEEVTEQAGLFSGLGFNRPGLLQRLGLRKFQYIAGAPVEYLQCAPLVALSEARKQLEEYARDTSVVMKVLYAGAIVLALAAGAILLRAVLTNTWAFLRSFFGGKIKEQSNRPQREKVRSRVKAVAIAQPQAMQDPVVDNTYHNTYKLKINTDSGAIIEVGQILFIEDTLAVMPAHFRHHVVRSLNEMSITKESKLDLCHSVQQGQVLSMSVDAFLRLEHTIDDTLDVMFVKFVSIRSHRNIRASFITNKDVDHVRGSQARLDVCNTSDDKGSLDRPRREVHMLPSLTYVSRLLVSGKYRTNLFRYMAATSVGDCGAPLSLLDGRSYSGRSIIGLHMAGNTNAREGYSCIVTREMVDAAVEHFKIVQDKFSEDLLARGIVHQAGNVMWTGEEDSFLPICTTTKSVNLCPKTAYYVTDMFGNLGPYNCYPAPLSPVWRDGALVYPMRNAVKPYGTRPLLFEDKFLKQAVYLAMKPLLGKIRDYSKREYTFEEAVLGVPEERFRSIPRGTSAGFPYIFDVRNGKKEFFGDGADYDISGPKAKELRDRVEHVNKCASEGVRLAHVFVDTLKDELRSAQKVQAVATRLISASPLDYLIAWRMKFGAFGSAVMRNPVVTGMAPGISATQDWGVLAELLRSKGDHVFDGDFKSFDSSQQPCVLLEIFEQIDQWYGGTAQESMARRVLWLDLIHSRHIGGAGVDQCHIYQWNKSLPSGHPFTTIVNSIYSLTMIIACYMHATGDLTGFWNHVMAVVYGDDNVVNVDDATITVFNQKVVAKQLLERYGMTYTAGNKEAELVESMSLKDVTFLKRRIVETDKGWLSPLDLESFLYTHYWSKNRKLERRIAIDVLENALEELSQHAAEEWAKYAPTIINCLVERAGGTRALPFQDQYLMLLQSRTDNWY